MADAPKVAPDNPVVGPQTATMNWEPIRTRLLGTDLPDAIDAAQSIRRNIAKLVQHPSEFALLLIALLPAFASILTSSCPPTAQGPNQKLRHSLLNIISKLPYNEILRPHASHLIVVAMDVLNKDFEENALLASHIIFNLYKTYRSLPQDHVQPFLDFVILVYQALPNSVKQNFSSLTLKPAAAPMETSSAAATNASVVTSATTSGATSKPEEVASGDSDKAAGTPAKEASTPDASTQQQSPVVRKSLLPSKISFRVLTECPLTVMLMFQLYPNFLQPNVGHVIKVMLDALSLKAPALNSILNNPDKNVKRVYYTRLRELVAAQAKTLSFVCMLLKTFSSQLAPFQDRLAQNVVDLFRSCPHESIGTRKELIAATRHLFNSDLRPAFVRHVDALLDERLFLGQHHRQYMSTLLRTMGYQILSELVQHVRSMLSMPQATRIVGTFARVLHDSLPATSQYAAVRTLLSLGEVIYRNTDPNPQIGRDMLVRILATLTSKLEAICVQEEDWEKTAKSEDFKDVETVRDAQSLVRFILVGCKSIVQYLSDYRNQREKVTREMALPPAGSNEEVASAYHKLTQTEIQLLNRYLVVAIPGLSLLKLPCTATVNSSRDGKVSDQYRDALTYFAATFATLDGHNLRRTIGRHMDLLVDAIVEDPMVMIVPRHLLAVNATTSFEFCAILVPYLMGRLNDLRGRKPTKGVYFLDSAAGDSDNCREMLISQCVEQSDDDSKIRRDTAQALLQLFERVLKSLNSYPENESIVRRYLRAIVGHCLAACLENTGIWPDDYCMLLRYVFRSITAGKFEESYRELLPLIPTVLNGLYRIICVCEDSMLRFTAMELCLTIPARLSSLLPHMSLLLRVIIPALDSGSGDLVNLGLRTLEFWVDNLNPLFLYPEMSKETPAFACLMQSLSFHLRPAPYPYGLLTLRLLGKLGGKNRQFLRDPLVLSPRSHESGGCDLFLDCIWAGSESDPSVQIPLPIERCLEILKLIAIPIVSSENRDVDAPMEIDADEKDMVVVKWDEYERLWTENIERVDFEAYAVDVREKTRNDQATSAMTVIRTAFKILISGHEDESAPEDISSSGRLVMTSILVACTIDSVKQEADSLLREALVSLPIDTIGDSISDFLRDHAVSSHDVVVRMYDYILELDTPEFDREQFWVTATGCLCDSCCSDSWEQQVGAQKALAYLGAKLGSNWAHKHELSLMNAAMTSLKSIPRELSGACTNAIIFFVKICVILYGKPGNRGNDESNVVWDAFSGYDEEISKEASDSSAINKDESPESAVGNEAGEQSSSRADSKKTSTQSKEKAPETEKAGFHPSMDVLSLVIRSLASPQQLARFASRFILWNYTDSISLDDFKANHLELAKRVLFSRSMKLLPLPYQVGVTEALTLFVTKYPGLFPLSEQYLLAFLSELLKMSSVADGDMSDPNLVDYVVDKNGFCGRADDRHHSVRNPSHSSAIFFRRECVIEVCDFKVHLPAELPTGVQLRVSSIKLLHAVIRDQSDEFFDAPNSTPIGNIRPHVISLLFRSLVSQPEKAVFTSYFALRDVLKLSMTKTAGGSDSSQAPSRLPKELLQTCIRPVLLNLREYQRLSVPLLRGLSKLLSLLSSWFNKTLGEKLLDHLQKWMDPTKILSLKLWSPGEEPAVAASIVEIFALLPHASNFVEPLVKTCMKLEASLPALKIRCVESPYRKPLARYLNKHPSSTVNFFFKRLPTPMYSELFQWLVRYEESVGLRDYLAGKPCSMMILNHCFEKPLGVIRADKDASTQPQSSRAMLAVHGIRSGGQPNDSGTGARMSTGALELQLQGFILVDALMKGDPDYIKEQSDIVRAFRWLWRSKGRVLRFKHESGVPPRYHSESRMLATFLVNYARSYPSEGLDILFELVSAFVQPATVDFSFLTKALNEIVTVTLSGELKQRVLDRFFELVPRDKSEEMKVLSIQYLLYPMLSFEAGKKGKDTLLDENVGSRFVNEVLYKKGAPIVCTDRLKVELLRLTNVMLVHAEHVVAPYFQEILQFCVSLLKSEDISCKGWAYVLIARLSTKFDVSESLVLQIYGSLLRAHQHENKELVRTALDVIIPALHVRMTEEKANEAVREAGIVIVEENSPSQLAHVFTAVLANREIFFAHRETFMKHIVDSLNRLGTASSSLETRVLVVDIVELLLDWTSRHAAVPSDLLSGEQSDVVANFLIRLKILMAEPHDIRGARTEISPPQLDQRVMKLISWLISRSGVEIRKQPFEKIASRERQSATTLIACVDLLDCFSREGKVDFFTTDIGALSGIVRACFVEARFNESLRGKLRALVEGGKDVGSIVSPALVALDQIITNATHEQRTNPSRGGDNRGSGSRTPKSRDKEKTSDAGEMGSDFIYFSVCLALDLGRHNGRYLSRITGSLLDFADVVAKNHLFDATAKQRQGSTSGSPNTSPGLLFHTPTRGILEESRAQQITEATRQAQTKPKTGKEAGETDFLMRTLLLILCQFEVSDLPFCFSQDRKSLFQILNSILDSSDNVQLVMVATRVIGKWLLNNPGWGPLTVKERNSFLWKVASFDFNGLSDDLAAQPLADLVSYFVESVRNTGKDAAGEGLVLDRSLVACSLHTRNEVRNRLLSSYLTGPSTQQNGIEKHGKKQLVESFWRLLHSDIEGLASRSWIVVFVDGFLMSISSEYEHCVNSLRSLAHGDVMVSQMLFERMLPVAWEVVPTNGTRLKVVKAIEAFLARPFHSQFQKTSGFGQPRERRCSNSIRAFLNGMTRTRPCPVLDPFLMVYVAENYCCWYEVISMLENQYVELRGRPQSKVILEALRHCYRQLGERDVAMSIAKECCELPKTKNAMTLDVYDMVQDAASCYEDLIKEVEDVDAVTLATDFEMDLWEERWVEIQRELCQLEVVSEFANSTGSLRLKLECSWKKQDWNTVKTLCTSTSLLSAVESGDPIVKISETLLAVADGKNTDVENLHAQTAQLCLHKWQLLPSLYSDSPSHASLLHFFHRLVEIRESGQIIKEASSHSKVKTLPDLKNLLNAWRHRLPNNSDPMTVWDDVFSWRAHMFSSIISNFSWSEPSTLATLHDRPWTAIRMAKTSRKHGMRDVSMLLLSKAVDERAMNVSDAFLKLREQILAYFNKDSERERHGGLNLINATNLSFFDPSQKSELFRLKASFLASIGSRSKANLAFCHSLQICPTHSRGWESWGGLCSALGGVAEKQVEDAKEEAAKDPSKKDTVASASKKVAQYLAQAMGCYLEAVQIDPNEWNRVHLPKCIWMLTKDGGSPGILCSTFENRGSLLPSWVWLPWLPQLFTSLYREEGRAVKAIFVKILKAYPQAIYYSLRAFFLERRDVERAKHPQSSGQLSGSAGYAEEMVSLLRRSHTSLWSSLESILEELLVKFRPSHEEEFLATIVALLERAEAQTASIGTEEEESVTTSVWKTLSRVAVKYFRHSESGSQRKDDRAVKTAEFKNLHREKFENDFQVSASEAVDSEKAPNISLDDILERIREWKEKMEEHVLACPSSVKLIESSKSLAMYCIGDSPDLWQGSCDPRYASPISSDRDDSAGDPVSTLSTTASVAAAKKAAITAAKNVASAAAREGIGGDYGGSCCIEIPGSYPPNTTSWADVRPSPELHPKLMRFEPNVKILKRADQLVRRVGMIGSDGRVYRFVLQCALPYWSRTDERSAQTYYILDKILRKSTLSARSHISMQPHTVIPVAQRLRLVDEPESQVSLEQVVRNHFTSRDDDPASIIRMLQEKVKEELSDKSYNKLEKEAKEKEEKKRRLSAYNSIKAEANVPENMLSQYMQKVLESPEPYFQFRRFFAMQWGANCLLQHVFQVIERTPGRVVFLQTNGRVLAPDFRVGYTNQGQPDPQATPFRLSPNLKHLLGFLLLDGRFTITMAKVATVVNEAHSDLDSILRLLMRDDLTAYFTKNMAKPDSKTQEMERQLTDRVAQNVASIQRRFKELAVKKTDEDEPVDRSVRNLIAQAEDPANVAMMTANYQGWI